MRFKLIIYSEASERTFNLFNLAQKSKINLKKWFMTQLFKFNQGKFKNKSVIHCITTNILYTLIQAERGKI